MIGLGSFFGLPLIRAGNSRNSSALVTFSEMPICTPNTSPSRPSVEKIPVSPQRTPAFGKLTVIGGRLVPSATSAAPKPRPLNPNSSSEGAPEISD